MFAVVTMSAWPGLKDALIELKRQQWLSFTIEGGNAHVT
jgi:hypothetical protein